MTSPGQPYPLQQSPLPLPSGRTVTVLNLFVFVRADGDPGALSIQYRSSLDATDLAGRQTEAAEVVEAYRGLIEARGYSAVSAQVCNTKAAAETREAPEASFDFVRDAAGRWTLRDRGELPRHDAS